MQSDRVIFTVGHSNQPAASLIETLRAASVELLVDVRAWPRSRRLPHFNREALEPALGHAGIAYRWEGKAFGGMRKPAAHSPHGALGAGLRAYADYADTEAFRQAIDALIALAGRQATVLMCAERQPLNCHRSLISDHLALKGVRVMHLNRPGDSEPHRLRPEARVSGEALIYDRGEQAALFD